jgi:hypothetical protein
MTAVGQERRIRAVCDISALPPRADVEADIAGNSIADRTHQKRGEKSCVFTQLPFVARSYAIEILETVI